MTKTKSQTKAKTTNETKIKIMKKKNNKSNLKFKINKYVAVESQNVLKNTAHVTGTTEYVQHYALARVVKTLNLERKEATRN